MIDDKNEDYKKYKWIFDELQDENIFDAVAMVKESADAIQAFIQKDNMERKLKDLPTDFI